VVGIVRITALLPSAANIFMVYTFDIILHADLREHSRFY